MNTINRFFVQAGGFNDDTVYLQATNDAPDARLWAIAANGQPRQHRGEARALTYTEVQPLLDSGALTEITASEAATRLYKAIAQHRNPTPQADAGQAVRA